MAGEFKIKTGLLLGVPSTSQPVNSIKDTSISITADASSILVTGKAVYDYIAANAESPLTFSNGVVESAGVVKIGGSMIDSITAVEGKNKFLYWGDGANEDYLAGWGVSSKLFGGSDTMFIGLGPDGTQIFTVEASTASTHMKMIWDASGLHYKDDYSVRNIDDDLWVPHKGWVLTQIGSVDYWTLDGSTLVPKDSTVDVQLSAIQIATDAGTVVVIDMDVSSATAGTEESYAFNIDGTQIAKVYAEGDGAAGIQNEKFQVLETFQADSSVYFLDPGEVSTSYVLFYNPTSKSVTYASGDTTGGAQDLSQLTDVSIGGTIQDGSVLTYNLAGQYWTYGSITSPDWGSIGGSISNQADLYNPWLVDLSTNISTKLENTTDTFTGILTVDGSISSGDITVTRDLDVTGNVEIGGNLVVEGSVYVIGVETLDVSNAFINLNTGLTTSPPSWMQSGLVIERGTEDPYAIIFDEGEQTFRIGISPKDGSLFDDASTQSVATREDDPNPGGVAFWNNDLFRFDTSSNFTTDGKDVSIEGKIFAGLSSATQPEMVFYNNATKEITYANASTAGFDTSTFISLYDTPNSYDPVDVSPGMAVVVNDSGDGIGFGPRIWREESDEVTLANEDANVLFYQYIELEGDAGVATFVDKSVTASSAIGTEESYTFNMDGNAIAKIYAQSDGAGSIQEAKFVSSYPLLAEASVYMSGLPDVSTSYVLFYDITTKEVTYASQGSISGVTQLSALTDVSIGGTIPDGSALIYNSAGSYWTYGIAGSGAGDYWTLDGSTLVPTDSTVDVKLGEIGIGTDAGAITLVDMDVSSATTGTEESYSFDIDGSTVAKVYGKAQTGGTLNEIGWVVETAQYMGDPQTNGSWRFYPDSNGDLVFEKRIAGTWTEKGKFTE